MRIDPRAKRKLTLAETLGVVAFALVYALPLIVLAMFSDNRVVQWSLGGGRILVIWIFIAVLIWLNRARVDRFFEKVAERLRSR